MFRRIGSIRAVVEGDVKPVMRPALAFPVQLSPSHGVDLYNLFNTNNGAGFETAFDHATQGASWLRPTSIVPPRFARVNVTLNF